MGRSVDLLDFVVDDGCFSQGWPDQRVVGGLEDIQDALEAVLSILTKAPMFGVKSGIFFLLKTSV